MAAKNVTDGSPETTSEETPAKRKRGVVLVPRSASIDPELDAKLSDITIALRHPRPQATIIAALTAYVDATWTDELHTFANQKFGA